MPLKACSVTCEGERCSHHYISDNARAHCSPIPGTRLYRGMLVNRLKIFIYLENKHCRARPLSPTSHHSRLDSTLFTHNHQYCFLSTSYLSTLYKSSSSGIMCLIQVIAMILSVMLAHATGGDNPFLYLLPLVLGSVRWIDTWECELTSEASNLDGPPTFGGSVSSYGGNVSLGDTVILVASLLIRSAC